MCTCVSMHTCVCVYICMHMYMCACVYECIVFYPNTHIHTHLRAMFPAQPHHMVLDMCAAPGSKTLQLLEALHQNAPPGGPTGE
jgi:hypothetical protein